MYILKFRTEKFLLNLSHFDHIGILGVGLELACRWGSCGESFQMQIAFISF